MSVASNQYFAYFPDFADAALLQLFSVNARVNELPALRLFAARYKAFPCSLKCQKEASNSLFHAPSILNYLKTTFEHNITHDLIRQKFHIESKQFFFTCRLCDLGNGIMVYIKYAHPISGVDNPNRYPPDFSDDDFLVSRHIFIYYLPEQDTTVQTMANDFLKLVVFANRLLKLSLVCSKPSTGYYLTKIHIKKPFIHDLALHYGEKFVLVHHRILKALNEKDSHGIVLLHGTPGSGKTHYIRYLIDEIETKQLIYLPPDMAKELSSPALLTFLLAQPNSILIIEDAENIIRDRTEQTCSMTQAVANLLNLSDGLLGDAIHMQIIATFNCDLTVVDKALLRKGRLIAEYNFEKLDVRSAQVLSEKLGFGVDDITMPMTLAEIYNSRREDGEVA